MIENNADKLTISVHYPDPKTAYELEQLRFTVGLPSSSLPRIAINYRDASPFEPSPRHPYRFDPADEPVEWERLERFRDLDVGILRISPLVQQEAKLNLVTRIEFTIWYPDSQILPKRVGNMEASLYRGRVVNWTVAKRWVHRPAKVRKSRIFPLPEGAWYRLTVGSDGVHKVTANALRSAGLNLENVEPRSLKMFTNPRGGRPMPSSVGIEIPENLTEVIIEIRGEADGSFDEGDEIIFYGRGPRGFDNSGRSDVTFTQNPFSDENTYWLNVPADKSQRGQRVSVERNTYQNPAVLNYGISYQHREDDLKNPFNSGLHWFGAGFTRNQAAATVFNLPSPKLEIDATVTGSVLGTTAGESDKRPRHFLRIFQKTLNDTMLTSASWEGTRMRDFAADLDVSLLADGPNTLVFQNASSDEASRIHVDWATVQYGRELKWDETPFEFWGPHNVDTVRFAISRVNSDVSVWEITDFATPVEPKMTLVGTTGYFERSLPDSQLARFIVFERSQVPEVASVTFQEDQSFSNLRTTKYPVDHITIAPEEFIGTAQRLMKHRLNGTVAPLQAIFDEFSGGVQDPLAIRYFLKWTKENWRNPSDGSFPSFVLLLGDGDYDYRNITGSSHNLVPTFQSSVLGGVSSDDRFGYLQGRTPEMAIGRFPAVTVTDADYMVDKTIAYEADPEIGLWRRRITLVADDFARPKFGRIEITHTKNSEAVAAMIPRSLELRKIYMEDFPEVSTGTQFGVVKPDATEALFDVLEQGTTVLNYIGHGSPYQWAQEGLLSSARGDVSSVDTGRKLPIWIAATCSWGRYDNVEGSAMSEEILRLQDNGAVGVISTTGLIGFSANRSFILKLFSSFFPEGEITDVPLGAIYSSIKDGSEGSELFHLFGDPALKVALAPDTVTIEKVGPDTLVALQTGSYAGHVGPAAPAESDGYVLLYDADRTVTRIYEEDGYTEGVTYTLPGRTLFRGLFSMNTGKFGGEFIVPKDINYATSDGRLAVYLFSKPHPKWEGLGVKENLILRGGTGNPLDSEGPLISFALEDRTVEWGDHIPEDAELIIRLSDHLGINVTGEVGHSIRLWLDEDEANAIDLTDKFVYGAQSFRSGSLTYSAADLSLGESLITVEAWDNANNPAQKSLSLHVTAAGELTLTNVFNYPNPFKDWTQFAFEVDQEANVGIKIFTLSGQLIKELDPWETFLGYSHINWDGRDEFGDEIANGAYVYQVAATPVDEGKRVTHIGKLVKYR